MILRDFRVSATALQLITTRPWPSTFPLPYRITTGISPRSITRPSSVSKTGRLSRLSPDLPAPFKASSWPLFAIVSATLLAAVLVEPFIRTVDNPQTTSSKPSVSEVSTDLFPLYNRAPSRTPSYSEMPIPPGHLGNLTPEQELKLRDFWYLTLKTFGVKDPNVTPAAPGISAPTISTSEPNTDSESPKSSNKKTSGGKKRLSLFGSKKNHDSENNSDAASTHSTPGSSITDDLNDKYGQTKEFQQTLAELSSEELRTTFWSMVKSDHPDALLLRFLRARKWDVQRALVMLISTMRWRSKEIHVDDDIMRMGEGGALSDSQTGDAFAKKEGADFLAQMRKGKSFLHGMDKEGRPVCFVRVRLHKQGEQSDRVMERYTVFVIETARLVLRPPVETATILFDMTSFTLSNMDYAPVKFMIKIFEANYPESLGAVLVHKAPWVFQGVWSMIKGWLDPVVAAKVHFTKTVEDLEQFIPRSQIVKELGGGEDWEYTYVEPVVGENDAMQDGESRVKLEQEGRAHVLQFQKKTYDWISKSSNDRDAAELARERDELAKKLYENYWALDPFIRARSLYDRQGMISKGGEIDFYPEQRSVKNSSANSNANTNGTVPALTSSAGGPDDVD